jgi:hypothetical protein
MIYLFELNRKGLILVCPHLITPIINQLNKQKRQRVYCPGADPGFQVRGRT